MAHDRPSTRAALALIAAAVLVGAGVAWLELVSDHRGAKAVWAVFAPAVGVSFVATGVYAWRQRPESRTGALMVLLGFAWFVYALDAANGRVPYTISQVAGGLWGSVFLHLGLTFPTGRARSAFDRRVVIAGYAIFPLAFVPVQMFSGADCDCPRSLLVVADEPALATAATIAGALLYSTLFVIVLTRASGHWRRASPFERLQLMPVYACSLLTFLLVTIAQAGAGDPAWWAAVACTGLMPLAFLGGLLRSHVSHLDAALRARLEELRASRARIVEAADTERRRLEPALHALASRAPVPVAIEAVPEERLPAAVESTIYFVVSEALANVAKYAHATHASVAVHETEGWIRVEVADDGVGGADATRGSGLRRLEDRVAVVEGSLSVDSPPGLGTRLRAELPSHERRFTRAKVTA